MQNWFIDTETCGLHGLPVLLQYAIDDSEIKLVDLWKIPISESKALIEEMCENCVIGFNLAFDWFHLCKWYTIMCLLEENFGPSVLPEDYIEEIAILERQACDGPCLKPKGVFDIMLYCRRGPYQSLMEREDIRIKKVPAVLAEGLRDALERKVQLDGIYFARRKDPMGPRWRLYPSRDVDGEEMPAFMDVVLKFQASGALKVLAEHVLKLDKKALRFSDVELGKNYSPEEKGYAPYALAVGKPGAWNGAWPQKIKFHISHWAYHSLAREYARDDIVYTRGLYEHFGRPEINDTDSILACMVASVRWRGFAIKIPHLQRMRDQAAERAKGVPTAPRQAKAYINEALTATEQAAIRGSTKKVILESISQMKCDCTFEDNPPAQCDLCSGSGMHPAAFRASRVLGGRKGWKKVEICDKLLLAGRFHASFRVIGALSSRMSGADGLNPQGIDHADETRDCFLLADSEYVLCGGDFDSFEAVLADADYNDPGFREALKSGKKIHIMFAECMYPGKTEAEIKASKGSTSLDMYDQGKKGVYSQLYYGDENTLIKKNNIDEDTAKAACETWRTRFPGIGRAQAAVRSRFCSIKQDKLGGRVVWNDPAEKIESLLGFPRYFTLENQICRALFELAQNPPKAWKDLKIKIVRRQDRGAQTVGGAVQSALFGAAFAIQAAAMRAAGNHRIQSSGAGITKIVQCKIWTIQPHGVHKFRVIPMNIHDEIMCPTLPGYTQEVKALANEAVESFRGIVPLIKMEWDIGLESWSKGLTENKVRAVLALKGQPIDEIAKETKVQKDQIPDILEGRTWTHLPPVSVDDAVASCQPGDLVREGESVKVGESASSAKISGNPMV